MPLSKEDIKKLHNAGFIDYEIFGHDKAFNTHETSDLSSPAWQHALASRKRWTQDKLDKGWVEKEIENTIMRYYTLSKKRNPWAFLKAEYMSPERRNYYEALRARAKRQTDALKSMERRR